MNNCDIVLIRKDGEPLVEKAVLEICKQLSDCKIPRWEELPDLELYMDQVLSLTKRYLGRYLGFDQKCLTASMVNNYVKLGVVPPPIKKRYARSHLARLIVVCILKASLPIDVIGRLPVEGDEAVFYNAFCDAFEASSKAAAESVKGKGTLPPVYGAALRAQAEQALARQLCEPDVNMEKSTD